MISISIISQHRIASYHFTHRTISDQEIDLIIERPNKPTLLIEIKSRTQIDERQIRTLQDLTPSFKGATPICIAQVAHRIKIKDVLVLPWRDALDEIFT